MRETNEKVDGSAHLELYMLFIFVLFAFITLIIIKASQNLYMDPQGNQNANQPISEKYQHIIPKPLSPAKKKEVIEFANYVVRLHIPTGVELEYLETKGVENDSYNRYLVWLEANGRTEQGTPKKYTAFMVIQQYEGQKYVLPFGVQIVEGNIDSLQKDIIISMLKVMNGWGNSVEEFQQRWVNALRDKKGFSLARDKYAPDLKGWEALDSIIKIQEIVQLINGYSFLLPQAIQKDDFNLVSEYLKEETLFYYGQEQMIHQLYEQNVRYDLLKLDILLISAHSPDGTIEVITKEKIRIYEENRIYEKTYIGTYYIHLKSKPQIESVKKKVIESANGI